MIPFGVLLIVLRISWLMDFNAWPALVIGAGTAYVLSGIFPRGRSSVWAFPACCYPWYWFGNEQEHREGPAEERADS